jgi:hypothetical protein
LQFCHDFIRKEEGRRKKEEGRRKKEEGRRKKEEGRRNRFRRVRRSRAKEEERREEEVFRMLGLFQFNLYPLTAPAVKP